MNIFYTLIFSCLFILNSYSQGKWTHYKHTGKNNEFTSLVIDSLGNKWVGSSHGLLKFDGIKWTSFTIENSGIPNNVVNCVYIDKKGVKWIGTAKGISKFNDSTWTNYLVKDKSLEKNNFSAFAEDSLGNLWVAASGISTGNYNKVYKLSNNNWIEIPRIELDNGTVYSMAFSNSGELYINVSNRLVIYDGTYSSNSSFYIEYLVRDQIGRIWCAKFRSGILYVFDKNTRKNINTNCGNITSLGFDNNGNKIFSSDKGLTKYNDTTFTFLNSNEMNKFCNSISVDNKGNIWSIKYDSYGSYLSKFDNNKLTTYTFNYEIHNPFATKIIEDNKNNIWLSTSDGLSQYDGYNWINYKTKIGVWTSDEFKTLAIDNFGNKWVGSRTGAYVFNDENIRSYEQYSIDSLSIWDVQKIICDKKGRVWIGTGSNYVKIFNGTNWSTLYLKDNHGTSCNSILDLHEDNIGNIWISTQNMYNNFSLFKFDGIKYTEYDDSLFHLEDMIYPRITSDNKGNIYLGTSKGLLKFNNNKWTLLNTKNSNLIHDYITSISTDRNENIWIGTISGVSVYDGVNWYNFKIDPSTNDRNNIYTIDFDKKGNTWIGSGYAVTKIVSNNKISSICMVTNENGKNKIYWKNNKSIFKYKIYKLSNYTAEFKLVTEVASNQPSEYIDNDDALKKETYKVTAVDSNNIESDLNTAHTTIFLNAEKPNNEIIKLIWNGYTGLNYSDFEIWKSSNNKEFSLLTTVPYDTLTFTDYKPFESTFYQIRIKNNDNCDSLGYIMSNSLHTNSKISTIENIDFESINIHPNPTKGDFIISSPSNLIRKSFKIIDLSGRIIIQDEIKNNEHPVDLQNLEKGIYIISFESGITKKIILE